MSGRVLALGLSLAVASVTQAGVPEVDVTLVPIPDKPTYDPDEVVRVEVFLSRVTMGSDILLRMVQLDFTASDSPLVLTLPVTHLLPFPAPDIRFWFFGSLAGCTVDPLVCGDAHFIEDELAGSRPNVVSIVYLGNLDAVPPDLGPSAALQLTLPGNGSPVKIGELDVTMPMMTGMFDLNVLNAAQLDPDIGGAEVHFGFEIAADPTPLTAWQASAGEVTGGTLTFNVGSPCHAINMVAAATAPVCETSLPWASNSVIRLTFGSPVTLPVAGEPVEIRELLAGAGNFGVTDLSGMFTFTLENGGTVLKIEETGTVLTDQTWYAILNTGNWCDPELFEVTFPMVRGNANNDGFTDFGDLSAIFASQIIPAGDQNPFDINRDNIVDFGDLSAAFFFNGGVRPAKPAGHDCIPVP